MKLYFKYVSMLIKSQLQYKASFIMMVVGQFLTSFALFAGIYFLFEHFGNIAGWTAHEVFLCYGVTGMSFAIAECFARGFDTFPNMIRTANFDRVLLRPRSTIFQVLGSGFDIKRVGRFVQGALTLVIAITGANMNELIAWDAAKIITLVNMIISGTLVFTGVMILQGAAAFWTTEGLEIANIFTDGMREHGSYPLNIYPKWLTSFFTFVIPYGVANYIPLEYILGRNQNADWYYMFIPLLSALFLIPSGLVWKAGVRRYGSAGS